MVAYFTNLGEMFLSLFFFSNQLKKFIYPYKQTGYNEDVMQQTVCLVTPIKVNNFTGPSCSKLTMLLFNVSLKL